MDCSFITKKDFLDGIVDKETGKSTQEGRRKFFAYRKDEDMDAQVERFYWFCRYYFPEMFINKWESAHKDSLRHHFRLIARKDKNFINLQARGMAKSNICQLVNVYKLCYRLFNFKVIVTHNDNSTRTVMSILNCFTEQNSRLRIDFPDVIPESVVAESNKKKTIKRRDSFEAYNGEVLVMGITVNKGIRGIRNTKSMRPDDIEFDDFETISTLSKPKDTKRIYEIMEETKKASDVVSAVFTYLCNYIDDTGNVHKLLQRGYPELNVPLYTVTTTGVMVPTWKDRFTVTKAQAAKKNEELITLNKKPKYTSIEEVREEFSENFDGEYLNQPNSAENRYFNLTRITDVDINEDISEVGKEFFLEDYNPRYQYMIASDVATGVGADHSTAVVLRFDPDGVSVVGYWYDNRTTPNDLGSKLIELGKKFGMAILAVEKSVVSVGTMDTLVKGYPIDLIYTESKPHYKDKNDATKYGVYCNDKTSLYGGLKIGLEEGKLIICCKKIYQEVRQFQHKHLKERIENVNIATGHFDLLSALAVGWRARDGIDRLLKSEQNQNEQEAKFKDFTSQYYNQ